jgi:hypothetical protein
VRNGMLSSATLNDLSSYSNNPKHIKFVNTTSMNDLQMCSESITTPIRFNKTKFSTPMSVQRRRALGLVSHNSNQISSTDDISGLNKNEPIIPQTSNPEDDLPHNSHSYQDTFDDLIPTNERIEHMIRNRFGGVNIFTYYGGIENTIRCQSPVCARVNVSTLLDMVDILN